MTDDDIRVCGIPECEERISTRARYCSDAHRVLAFRRREKIRAAERDLLLADLTDALARAQVA